MSKKIVVLYHRQPYDEIRIGDKLVFQEKDKPNGIIPLLKSFFSTIDSGTWIATSEVYEDFTPPLRQRITLWESSANCILRRVPVTREDIHLFYHKTSKEGFWPILHTFPEKYRFDCVDWANFVEVNKKFAKAAVDESDDNTIVWIHDYNLWLAPHFIRKMRPDITMAFFFHTPFPSPDIFNILPWSRQIIESLLCCDLLSFDIPRYVENFVSTAKSNFAVQIKKREKTRNYLSTTGTALSEPWITRQMTYNGRLIKLDAFPEGTNCQQIDKILGKDSTLEKIKKIKSSMNGCKLIFSASRVDYIKGIGELLECYERLLLTREDLLEKVVLFVVAVEPAKGISAYQELQTRIRYLLDKINTKFQTSLWEPVIYSDKSLSFEEMIAWFSVTDIMWVPSLRDGMNITCKEFVAVKKDSGGVLVLSEFAGASIELHEAVLTNPYSPDSMDNAIALALEMPLRDQRVRMKKMYRTVLLSDIGKWSRQLNDLRNLRPEIQI